MSSYKKVVIREKGQITIPHKAREKLGLSDSDVLEVDVIGKAIILTKSNETNINNNITTGNSITLKKVLKDLKEGNL